MKVKISLLFLSWILLFSSIFFSSRLLNKRFAAGWLHFLYSRSIVSGNFLPNNDVRKIEKICANKFFANIGYWPDIYKTYQIIAAFEIKRGDYQRAYQHLIEGLRLHPYYPNAYLLLSFLLSRQGHKKNALACFNVYKSLKDYALWPTTFGKECFEGINNNVGGLKK